VIESPSGKILNATPFAIERFSKKFAFLVIFDVKVVVGVEAILVVSVIYSAEAPQGKG
jgi:hypothetical protein